MEPVRPWPKLSPEQLSLLKLYGEQTYSIFFNGSDRKIVGELEAMDILQWVPQMFGGISWARTEFGAEVWRKFCQVAVDNPANA